VLYLKRHRVPLSWWQRVGRACGRSIVTEGGREWRNILALHDEQVPTVMPVAVGERVRNGLQESFVVTRGLEEYESLERLAPKRFVPPLTGEVIAEKRALIRAIAAVTARMHWKRMCHRDYYFSHIFVRRAAFTAEVSTPDVRLIDLQRVLIRPWFWPRWVIKDLASLYYHAAYLPEGCVKLTRTDVLRFLKVYCPERMRDRRFMTRVRRKAERIARHAAHVAHA
jgi:heptose I phosphotransferase